MSTTNPRVSNSYASNNPDIEVSTVSDGNGNQVQNFNLFGGYISLVDEASSTVTYLGKAVPSSITSAAVWQIQRISVSGTITAIELADGNAKFDNIWNNRASLSYS